ncbi:hypothetical protein PHET_06131 [Paragonimus heterotremus]|uniref:Uncharacterized protein n=1 Tax=Paragonimus heterotremus TaxID=100268 RepID=A0A8J4WGE4_9TREM|nr:hypothetical protein PHET_06131 [Paragonimus heterotremus]
MEPMPLEDLDELRDGNRLAVTPSKRQTGWNGWRRKKSRNRRNVFLHRPSVALADYEISDTRTSAMSSLLLLFATLECMCGFVLPICSAFSKPTHRLKRYYYEDFLLFQYCFSILALCYLQALIFYYDQKENFRHKCCQKLAQQTDQLNWDKSATAQSEDFFQFVQNSLTGEQFGSDRQLETVPTAPPTLQSKQNLRIDGSHSNVRPLKVTADVVPHSEQVAYNLPSQCMATNQLPRLPVPSFRVAYDVASSVRPTIPEDSIQMDTSPRTQVNSQSETQYSSETQVHNTSHSCHERIEVNPTETMKTEGRVTPTTKKSSFRSNQSKTEKAIRRVQLSSVHRSTPVGPRRTSKLDDIVPLQFLFGDRPEDGNHRGWYFSRDTEGVNLYLRLGAVGFGFGVMVFDGFKIAEPWEAAMNGAESCYSQLWIPIHFLHFFYVFWQTYFVFKHHQASSEAFLLWHILLAYLSTATNSQKFLMSNESIE